MMFSNEFMNMIMTKKKVQMYGKKNTVSYMNSNDTNMMHKFPCKHICYKSQTLYLIDESIYAF